jgi:hypothetical protein
MFGEASNIVTFAPRSVIFCIPENPHNPPPMIATRFCHTSISSLSPAVGPDIPRSELTGRKSTLDAEETSNHGLKSRQYSDEDGRMYLQKTN